MSNIIHINDKPFVIEGLIPEGHVDPFATAVRQEGNQRPGGVTARNSVILPPAVNGMGYPKIGARDIDNPQLLKRSADSTLDTRFVPTTLPRTLTASVAPTFGNATSTDAGLYGPIASIEYKGNLVGLFGTGQSVATRGVVARTFTGSTVTWGGGGILRPVSSATSTIDLNGGSGGGSGWTITITVNGSATVLTEGVHWNSFGDGSTDAGRIKDAINSYVAGVVATTLLDNVIVTLDATEYSLVLTENGSTATHVTSSRTGVHTSQSLAVDKNYIVAAVVEAGAITIYRSTTGTTWSVASTLPTTAITAQAAGDDDDAARLVNIPGVASYLFAWDEANLTVDTWKSTDQCNVWTSANADGLSAPNGVHGAGVYYDLNGDAAPYVLIDDGLYAYDTSADTWQQLVSVPATANTGKAHTVWANPFRGSRTSVYFGFAGQRMIEYTQVNNLGDSFVQVLDPNFFGALASDKQGDFWRMVNCNLWLFFTKGGGSASEKAWIGAYDGRAATQSPESHDYSEGFHFINQTSTANQRMDYIGLSSSDDNKLRIHIDEKTAATTSTPQHILYPLSHPDGPDAIVYDASGSQTRPRIDMGFPHDSGAVLAVALEADDLTATTAGEYINLDYGMNAAAPTTDIGNILSGARVLELGSGAGISFREVQIKENYFRDAGDTTQTPKGNDMEIIYTKQILKITPDLDGAQVLRQFSFWVDLVASAQGQENQTPADVLSLLYAAELSDVLVRMELGKAGSKADPLHVKLRVVSGDHDLSSFSENYGDEATTVNRVHVQCNTLS
jgi:hypothetical protein